VYGLFPANSVGDDVEVYTNGSRKHLRTKFHFLRQQIEKATARRIIVWPILFRRNSQQPTANSGTE